ncbi:hypothetical protein JAAARDRAFT_604869 [Jaapia argillacea MUCL 33604]|uniref:RBR-type E3 ubiquitin transferase n=1 Tax=Jaapia argillacea MUCL 33604 TaxID=933084 RepID=A0A067QCT0_9AGAM|nr:hypothetical protein JAAARDRAFT_604869 [Jaapia argillacea MUCL 33604]
MQNLGLRHLELAYRLSRSSRVNLWQLRLAQHLPPRRDQIPLVRNAPTPPQTTAGGGFFSWLFGGFASTSSSSSEPSRPAPLRRTGNNCVICQDPIVGVEVRSPCGHFYDKSCVLDLFEAATKDETLFPPRCCRQEISLAQVRPHMTATLSAVFDEKAKEFGTLKRVYCANPKCSRFLGEANESSWFGYKIYGCPDCSTKTCSRCKTKTDPSVMHSCKVDDGNQEVLSLGQQQGWARCPGCHAMVELNLGCFHMTCRCKTQFCYMCKALWKNCPCPQWEERRLIAAAEERVDREIQAAGVNRARGPAEAAARPPAPRRAAAPPPPPAVFPVGHRGAPARRAPVAIPEHRPTLPQAVPAREAVAARTVQPYGSTPAAAPRPSATPLTPTPYVLPPLRRVPSQTPVDYGTAPARRLSGAAEATVDQPATPRDHNASAGLPLREWLDQTSSPSNSTANSQGARSTPVAYPQSIPNRPLTSDNHSSGTSSRWRSIASQANSPTSLSQPSHSVVSPPRSSSDASPSPISARRSSQPQATTTLSSQTSPLRAVNSTSSSSSPESQLVASWLRSQSTSSSSSQASRTRPSSMWDDLPTAPSSPQSRSTSQFLSPTAERTRRVREMMERLRHDHDCTHERWYYRSGGGPCQSCHHHLRLYLFRCSKCQMLACNRCRRNRL